MSHKIIVSIAFLFTLSTGCDDRLVDDLQASHDGAGCAEPGLESEPEEHPYLSCDDPVYDPVCALGCGIMTDPQGHGDMFCAIPCEVASDCTFAAGPSQEECIETRCYYFCTTDDDCPQGLECVSRGDLLPGDPYPTGECMAPYSEP